MQNKKNAFTLIELLIIIAVMATLTAALFPVFVQAREKKRETTSLSQWMQLSTAGRMYVQDYDEKCGLGGDNSLHNSPALTLRAYVKNESIVRNARFMSTSSDACMAVDPTGEWQSTEGGCKDTATHLVWSDSARFLTKSASTYSYAQDYCAGLNSTSGYTGWGLASLSQHQTAYANGGANYITNPSLYISWTSSTYAGQGQNKGLTYDKAFDWSLGQEHDILIQTKTGSKSSADVICVRQGL